MGKAISRDTLLRKLDAALEKKLTLLIAPAGYGKTTLLTLFRRRHSRKQLAFLTLGQEHASPADFLTAFIDAFQRFYPRFGKAIAANLSSLTAPLTEADALRTAAALGAYCEQELDDDIIFIVDDYHHTHGQPLVALWMRRFLEHTSPFLHLLIASRYDAGIESARLAAQEAVLALSETDLRFSAAEQEKLLTESNTALSADLAAALAEKTGGWAACLVLAKEVLRGQSADEQHRLVEALASQKSVHDFLLEELYRRQPAPLQAAMLYLSVPDFFSPALALRLTQDSTDIHLRSLPKPAPDAAPPVTLDLTLNSLLERHLLSEQDGQYRFHSLTRDFLLKKLSADSFRHLSGISASHFEAEGDTDRALFYFVQAADVANTLKWLERRIVIDRLYKPQYGQWLDAALEQATTDIDRHRALHLLALHHIDFFTPVALAALERAYAYYAAQARGSLTHLSLSRLKMLAAFRQGDKAGFEQRFLEVMSLTADNPEPQALALRINAMHRFAVVHDDVSLLEDAVRLAASLDDPVLQMSVLGQLIEVYRRNFQQAGKLLELLRQLERLADRHGNPQFRFKMLATVSYALCNLGNYVEGKRKADAGLQLAADYGFEGVTRLTLLKTRRLFYHAAGALEKSLALSLEIEALEEVQLKVYLFLDCAYTAQLYAELGKLSETVQHAALTRSLAGAEQLASHPWMTASLRYTDIAVAVVSGNDAAAEAGLLEMLAQSEPVPSEAAGRSPDAVQTSETYQVLTRLRLCALYLPNRLNAPDKFIAAFEPFITLIARRADLYDYGHLKQYFTLAQAVLRESQTHHSLESHRPAILFLLRLLDEHRRDTASELAQESRADEPPNAAALGATGGVPKITVQTFGKFSVKIDGRELGQDDWQRKKARDVFKVLLLHYGRALAADALIELVWSETVGRTGSGKPVEPVLMKAASYIRKALEPSLGAHKPSRYLAVQDKSYTLHLGDSAEIDFLTFKRLIRDARAAAGDAQQALYEQAVSLYTGDFLNEDLYEAWSAFERETLRESYLHALLFLARAAYHAQPAQPDRAIGYAKRILETDRTDEAAYELLLTLYRDLNRAADAERLYAACVAAFERELGSPPPKKLEGLSRHP